MSSPFTPEQAAQHIIANNPEFAVEQAQIRGIPHRVFAHVPRHLTEFLQRLAPQYSDGRDMLVYEDERWDYSTFCHNVQRMADAMARTYHVQQGDHVALAMRNLPEMAVLLFAVNALGAVVVPLNAWWTAEELEYAVADCNAKLVFADGQRYERLAPYAAKQQLPLVGVRDAVAPAHYTELLNSSDSKEWPAVAIQPDDDFAILYSSGSTGSPKGAVLTHRGAMSATYSWVFALQVRALVEGEEEDPQAPLPAFLMATPLFHVTALESVLFLGFAVGAKVVLVYKWDAEKMRHIINAEKITRLAGVPTQTADLMQVAQRHNDPMPSLTAIGSGGAKRPAAQVQALTDTFSQAAISSGWGMTETNALGLLFSGPEYTENPDATGRPTPPLQDMQIVDDNGQPVAVGEVGELIVKSPANMRAYHNAPDDTAEALRDGWLYTGDLARNDENGLFYLVDRKKSIIIRGGENISCLEVEGALHRHPEVLEACVFPVPHERLGETVAAAVTVAPGSTVSASDINAFLAEHLAAYKIPEHLWFWYQPLPRASTDKIDKRTLAQTWLEQHTRTA